MDTKDSLMSWTTYKNISYYQLMVRTKYKVPHPFPSMYLKWINFSVYFVKLRSTYHSEAQGLPRKIPP